MQDYYKFWHNSIYGAEFYQAELNALKNNLKNIFGFHILQIGADHCNYLKDLGDKLKINHKITLSANVSDSLKNKNILYANDCLIPLASQSIDAVLLAHAFEASNDPHSLLREVDRILLPEGHLIILCFNPWSLWGVRKGFTFKKSSSMEKTFPWDDVGKWFSSHRVTDWLSLLNYKITFKQHYFFRPYINNEKIFRYMSFFDHIGKIIPIGAAGFCIIAVKKQPGLECIRPSWQNDISFVGKTSYIEPSMRTNENL